MRTLLDLANRLDKLSSSIPKQASEGAVKIAMAIEEDLTFNTPVDTSKALSNWIVTLDVPTDREIDPYSPGNFGSTQYASATEAIQAAERILKTKKPGQKIYIVNNTSYIEKLNSGSSKQVPAGFVERAVLVGRLETGKIKIIKL